MIERVIKQQMGASYQEFFRLLPLALGTDAFTVDGNHIICTFDGKRIEIDLGPEGERRIALLAIPSTPVEIRMAGFDDQEYEAFMVNFERAYQRGGG